MNEAIEWIGIIALLSVPLTIVQDLRALTEVSMFIVNALFLVHCVRTRSWGWIRKGWVPFALAWWGWEIVCSLPLPDLGQGGVHSLLEALVMGRFFLFIAAMELWLLREARVRRWVLWAIQAACLYIGLQSLLQYATGYNTFGNTHFVEGELTGPYSQPRAGPVLVRMMFPAILPPVATLLGRPDWLRRGGGAALAVAGVVIMVLISQRMPLLLTGFGFLVAALFIRRLRVAVIIAGVLGVLVLGASPIIYPPAYQRLVDKFSHQMEHFRSSAYGRVYWRAVVITEKNPWTGRGFDGFRNGCRLPQYFHGFTWSGRPSDGGGAAICVIHPHNYYLQASTDAGVPGLLLFTALVVAWMMILGRGLWREPDPLRVGLFVGALVNLWPIASTSDFFALPTTGAFFLVLGLGLAVARATQQRLPSTTFCP